MLIRHIAALLLLSTPYTSQAGLVGHWGFDAVSNSGVTPDTLGVHPGRINGASSVNGYDGNGLLFNGDDYVDISTTTLPTRNFTISFWANLDTSLDQGLFSLQNDSGYSNDRHIGIKDGQGYVRVWTRDSIREYQTPEYAGQAIQDWHFDISSVNSGQWHQWTLTVEDNIGMSMYIDDVLVSQKMDIDHSDFDWETKMTIGYSRDIGYTVGAIDEVYYFDSSLTPSEVNAFDLASAKVDVSSTLGGGIVLLGFFVAGARRMTSRVTPHFSQP